MDFKSLSEHYKKAEVDLHELEHQMAELNFRLQQKRALVRMFRHNVIQCLVFGIEVEQTPEVRRVMTMYNEAVKDEKHNIHRDFPGVKLRPVVIDDDRPGGEGDAEQASNAADDEQRDAADDRQGGEGDTAERRQTRQSTTRSR